MDGIDLVPGHQTTMPFGEMGGAVLLEGNSGGESARQIEMVAARGVDGGEFLRTSQAPEPPCFVADLDAALLQPVVDIVKRSREPNVLNHRQADNLVDGLGPAERAAPC
ncbi:MAG: hypothetical protein KDA73_15510 [Rhodobacteraceae bacterium]|nr:hypothetical protein [Paracoccaceae bacterium]